MSLLTDLFDAQLAILKSDLKNDLIPKIQEANNLIASNPTALNVVAQADAIVAAGIQAGPGVLQDEIKGLATWVNTQLQSLVSTPAATASAAAAPPAAKA